MPVRLTGGSAANSCSTWPTSDPDQVPAGDFFLRDVVEAGLPDIECRPPEGLHLLPATPEGPLRVAERTGTHLRSCTPVGIDLGARLREVNHG